ncbi:MAG: peptide-methionine (R)-S-oxide reductase MsrB [Candidatus Paceibacterota bacterium]
MKKVEKTEEEWKKELTEEQYAVMREGETEAPFSGEYINEKGEGVYTCTACGNELFSSDAKFKSGSGWPSFDEVISKGNVELHENTSGGMIRTEVVCAACGSHLGHVFEDGPTESGKRYCINSVCLNLKKDNGN